MKLMNKLKLNKGATLTDIVIAMAVIVILGGTVVGMFYKLFFNTSMIRLNAIAVNYAVNILEETDKLSYDEVVDTINFKEKFDIPDFFTVSMSVKKYNEYDNEKEDIIKIITLTIKYELQGNEEQFTVSKLKIKEI